MRAILIGQASERQRLRGQLGVSIEIVGEALTIAEARASAVDADAFIVASRAALVSRATLDSRPTRGAVGDTFDGLVGEDLEGDAYPETLTAEALTPREVQVLELLAEGLPNKAIATALGISDQTVKFHVPSISGKLGATNRTDAVKRAVRRGLIAL